jgi:hypothetical protein
MSALVIAYARPLTKGRDWPTFPPQLMEFGTDENTLHDHMIELRNTLHVHSDSKNYSVRPWRSGGFNITYAKALLSGIQRLGRTYLRNADGVRPVESLK